MIAKREREKEREREREREVSTLYFDKNNHEIHFSRSKLLIDVCEYNMVAHPINPGTVPEVATSSLTGSKDQHFFSYI